MLRGLNTIIIFASAYNNYKMQQHHPILELFGKNVQRLRTEQNISQEKLAEKAHLHRTYIGMVERAERNITLINMQKIASALGVQIGELLED